MKRAPIDPLVTYQSHGFNMNRGNFEDVPQIALPDGYHFRAYGDGDEAVWTALQRAAEPFFGIPDTLFEEQYGSQREALSERMWFVETVEGSPVASISAWWEQGPEVVDDRGRIHWVVVHPDHQGRGLSKAMMTQAMTRLARSHAAAMLGTSSGRPWAVKVYLDFGFSPDLAGLADEETLQAWRNVQSVIDHPQLRELCE